jgi:hypothetical protein
MVNFKQIFAGTMNFWSRKPNNASIVSRADQYAGEYAKELPFTRYYDYYHGTPSVKRNINSIHKRWMGSKIDVKSESPVFDNLWKYWSMASNFIPKLKEFSHDTLITGTGLFERQYYNNMFANLDHIPTKTLWKMFRDEFARKLTIFQMNKGDIKELSPTNIIVMTINNPERDAVGKSEMYAIAVPQKVTGKVDETGTPINPDRYLPSILDMKTRLNFAHMEMAEKQAKSRWILQFKNAKDAKRQKEIERSLENDAESKYMTVTDSEVVGTPIHFPKDVANERYLDDMDKQINQTAGFPGNVIDETQSGFASAQTPIQDLAQRIEDMQNDLSMIIENEVFKPLCEQWDLDFYTVKPKLVFSTFVEKLTFEQLVNLLKVPDLPLADTERRDTLSEFIPNMDDAAYEKWKKENDQKLQEQRQHELATGSKKTDDPKNPRPDIEKGAPKPDKSSEMHPILTNPKSFEKYVENLIEEKAKEYFFPPSNGQPYEAPYPEITNPEILERVKQMLEDVKNGTLPQEELEKTIKKLSKEVDAVGRWISELKDKHTDWKHDQIVAVALKKSKEKKKKSKESGKPTPHTFTPLKTNPTNCKICGAAADDINHKVEDVKT